MPPNIAHALFSDNVPDPTDFPPPSIAPGLRDLDAALRCTICGELYDAPVTLPCGHCFCSYCIRTAMGEKQECPNCRKSANEGHLRPNLVMEEAVVSWKMARPCILRLSKAEEQRATFTNSEYLSTPKVKKRKLSHNEKRSSSPEIILVTGSSEARSSSKSPSKSRHKPNSSKDTRTLPISDISETEGVEVIEANSAESLVSCPICNKQVPLKTVNAHIDSGCKKYTISPITFKSQSKQQWNKILGSQRTKGKGKQKDSDDSDEGERLPKASYGTLKDKAIKQLLVEQGLPVHGDKNQWIERHRRWVMIYNANLDRSEAYRKTKIELRGELKKWEEDTKKKGCAVDDAMAYQKRQKSEFDRLIELARQNKAKPTQSNDAAPSSAKSEDASGESKVPLFSPTIHAVSPPLMADSVISVGEES